MAGCTRVLATAALGLAVAATSGAADVSLGLDLSSSYTWRAITFNDGAVAQPSLDVSGLKLGRVPIGINVWTNFSLSDSRGATQPRQFSEVDFTLTAKLPRGFELGFVEYVFAVGGTMSFSPAPEPSTREGFVRWSREGPLTPTVAFYYDVEQIDGGYLLVSLARGLDLPRRATLSFQGDLGIAGGDFARYYGGTKGGFHHYHVSTKLELSLGAKGSLSANVGYGSGFDPEILPRQDVRLHAGLGASISF